MYIHMEKSRLHERFVFQSEAPFFAVYDLWWWARLEKFSATLDMHGLHVDVSYRLSSRFLRIEQSQSEYDDSAEQSIFSRGLPQYADQEMRSSIKNFLEEHYGRNRWSLTNAERVFRSVDKRIPHLSIIETLKKDAEETKMAA